MQSFSPLSQYLCSKCGSILKETDAQIEISTIVEDCPNCGAFLANTLKKQPRTKPEISRSLPKLQTAFDLMKFRLDIEKISSFMPLSTTGPLCIVGHMANLLLTRLCVRALLPANYGGLDSPYVVVVDAGNKSDFYQTVNFVRQYGLNLRNALDRIIVSRTFTIHQLKSLLSRELPKVVQKYQARVVFVTGLLDMFDDPNIKQRDAKRVIEKITKSINNISNRLLVVTSIQPSKHANLVTPNFDKRIVLTNANHSRLNADLYNDGRKFNITLTERELRLVHRK